MTDFLPKYTPGTHDQLRAAQKHLDGLRADSKKALIEIQAQLDQAEEKGNQYEIKRWTARKEGMINTSTNYIRRALAKVNELQTVIDTEVDRQRDQARAALDTKRQQALEAWLNSGGDEGGFAERWPAMESDILAEQTQEALNPQKPKYNPTIRF